MRSIVRTRFSSIALLFVVIGVSGLSNATTFDKAEYQNNTFSYCYKKFILDFSFC